MKNFIIRFIACFIPIGSARRAFRKKYLRPSIKDRIRALDKKLDIITESLCVLNEYNNKLEDKVNIVQNSVNNLDVKSNGISDTVNLLKDTSSSELSSLNNDIKNHINTHFDSLHQNDLINEVQYIKNFLTSTTDITKISPAHGILELIQQSSVKILKRFDSIARKHGIKYWLGFGTLIGAIRHNGFIPWDDDIDICILRSDYEKLNDILNKEFVDQKWHFAQGDIIRLFYKKTPAQVDIFPIDQGWQSEALTGEERSEFINKLAAIKRSIKYSWFPNLEQQIPVVSQEEVLRAQSERDAVLFSNHTIKDDGFCYLGIETASIGNFCLFSYKDIFPLKEIQYYGIKTYVPNDTTMHLIEIYGDFMSFPGDIHPKHQDIESRTNNTTIKEMKDLLKNE